MSENIRSINKILIIIKILRRLNNNNLMNKCKMITLLSKMDQLEIVWILEISKILIWKIKID